MHAVELEIATPEAGMLRYAREYPWPEFFIVVERKHVIGPSWPR